MVAVFRSCFKGIGKKIREAIKRRIDNERRKFRKQRGSTDVRDLFSKKLKELKTEEKNTQNKVELQHGNKF